MRLGIVLESPARRRPATATPAEPCPVSRRVASGSASVVRVAGRKCEEDSVLAVVQAFALIGVVVAVGGVVGRTGVLGENARMVLNRTAFHIRTVGMADAANSSSGSRNAAGSSTSAAGPGMSGDSGLTGAVQDGTRSRARPQRQASLEIPRLRHLHQPVSSRNSV
jgi:hypothetical protein